MAKNKTNTSYAEEGLEAINQDAAEAEALVEATSNNNNTEVEAELTQVGGLEPIAFYYRTSAPKKPQKAPFRILEKGQTINGTYERMFEGKKYKNPTFIIRTEEGLVGLSGAGSLNRSMDKLAPGSRVKITYLGMSPMKSGEFAGTDAHNFTVFGNKFKA